MSAEDNGVAFYMDDALVARIAYTDCLERSVMPTVNVTNVYVGASTRSQVRLTLSTTGCVLVPGHWTGIRRRSMLGEQVSASLQFVSFSGAVVGKFFAN